MWRGNALSAHQLFLLALGGIGADCISAHSSSDKPSQTVRGVSLSQIPYSTAAAQMICGELNPKSSANIAKALLPKRRKTNLHKSILSALAKTNAFLSHPNRSPSPLSRRMETPLTPVARIPVFVLRDQSPLLRCCLPYIRTSCRPAPTSASGSEADRPISGIVSVNNGPI